MTKLLAALIVPAMLATSNSFFPGKQCIDQNTVREEGGFPYKIKKPGRYKLTGNLVVPAGRDGIDILVSDVTLDLNGFSITGPVECSDSPAACPAPGHAVGINASVSDTNSPTGITIRNGHVRGMDSFGIELRGDGSSVEGVTAEGNAGTGILSAGSVLNSSALGNGQTGILAGIVRDSISSSNGGDGIVLDGRGSVGIGNVSSKNGGRGIAAAVSSLSNNTSTLNHDLGIDAACPSSIVANTVAANGGSIRVSGTGCVQANNATLP